MDAAEQPSRFFNVLKYQKKRRNHRLLKIVQTFKVKPRR